MVFLTVDDLSSFASIEDEKAQQMIEDATALAMLAAPCLATDPTELLPGQVAAVRAILRGAILRWNDAGTGAIQTESIDDYSRTMDNRQTRKGMFWPSEITQLQDICGTRGSSGVFAVDTISTSYSHALVCDVLMGGLHCTCGAWLSLGTAYFPS